MNPLMNLTSHYHSVKDAGQDEALHRVYGPSLRESLETLAARAAKTQAYLRDRQKQMYALHE